MLGTLQALFFAAGSNGREDGLFDDSLRYRAFNFTTAGLAALTILILGKITC